VDSAKLFGLLVFALFLAVMLWVGHPSLGLNQLTSLTSGGVSIEPHILVYSNKSIGKTINLTIINSYDFNITIYDARGNYFRLARPVVVMPGSSSVVINVINGAGAYQCMIGPGCNITLIMGFLGVNITETTVLKLG